MFSSMPSIFLPFLAVFAYIILISPDANAQSATIDSSIRSFHILHIQGKRYTVLLTTRGCFILKGKDTVVRHQGDYFLTMTFKDFDKDGYSDILIERNENTPNVCDLLLYDPILKSFKEVKDFEDFPNPMPIPKTKLYYSYYASGCADNDWASELFYIDHFKAVILGKVHGSACEADLSRSIHIYKATGTKFTLLKALPISTVGKYGDKWDFIKHYWFQMYKRFV